MTERGMTAITFVVAAGLSLVMFVSLVNVTAMLFARGAIRAATEEAARVGARSEAPVAACEARARAVLEGLLGPAMRAGVSVRCSVGDDPAAVHARADASLVPWWPGVPRWTFVVDAVSGVESLP